MPMLRCLFCNHNNPAEASFCNACGSQLNLQPCGQCGAVDSRTAKSCHKCGTPFAPALVSEFDALLAPASHGDQWDYSSRIEASVAGAKAILPTYDQPRTSNDRQLTVGAVAPDRRVSTIKPGSSWLVPGVALLGVALAATFAIFYQRPVTIAPLQTLQQAAPRVAETPATTAPLTVAAVPTSPEQTVPADPIDAAAPSEEPPTAISDEPAKVSARTQLRTTTKLATPPVPVAEPQPAVRREPPAIKDCSQALATLGLCVP